MKLVMLGTGGFLPTDTAQTACYLLPEVGILLDAGTGLYRMSRYLQTPELDIYLTHAHGDHTRGLIFLFASFFVNSVYRGGAVVDEGRIPQISELANEQLQSTRIHASQPTLEILTKEYPAFQKNWRVLLPRESLPGDGTLTIFSVGNKDEVGFRLDWPGHSLAYVTDTTARSGAPYIEYLRGVNVLLHDCNGPNRLAKMMESIHHSYPAAAAQVAIQAQVGQLVLIHQNPIEAWSIEEDLEATRKIFPETIVGVDGMEIEF
jgi:ribonuclease BN (tRNA processing enzyme)